MADDTPSLTLQLQIVQLIDWAPFLISSQRLLNALLIIFQKIPIYPSYTWTHLYPGKKKVIVATTATTTTTTTSKLLTTMSRGDNNIQQETLTAATTRRTTERRGDSFVQYDFTTERTAAERREESCDDRDLMTESTTVQKRGDNYVDTVFTTENPAIERKGDSSDVLTTQKITVERWGDDVSHSDFTTKSRTERRGDNFVDLDLIMHNSATEMDSYNYDGSDFTVDSTTTEREGDNCIDTHFATPSTTIQGRSDNYIDTDFAASSTTIDEKGDNCADADSTTSSTIERRGDNYVDTDFTTESTTEKKDDKYIDTDFATSSTIQRRGDNYVDTDFTTSSTTTERMGDNYIHTDFTTESTTIERRSDSYRYTDTDFTMESTTIGKSSGTNANSNYATEGTTERSKDALNMSTPDSATAEKRDNLFVHSEPTINPRSPEAGTNNYINIKVTIQSPRTEPWDSDCVLREMWPEITTLEEKGNDHVQSQLTTEGMFIRKSEYDLVKTKFPTTRTATIETVDKVVEKELTTKKTDESREDYLESKHNQQYATAAPRTTMVVRGDNYFQRATFKRKYQKYSGNNLARSSLRSEKSKSPFDESNTEQSKSITAEPLETAANKQHTVLSTVDIAKFETISLFRKIPLIGLAFAPEESRTENAKERTTNEIRDDNYVQWPALRRYKRDQSNERKHTGDRRWKDVSGTVNLQASGKSIQYRNEELIAFLKAEDTVEENKKEVNFVCVFIFFYIIDSVTQ
nr:PREDICTED: uncharacterized protein LOC106706325 [Latimeria chalumnae]|eukprot:XP_014352576.1 PREDICTED: uncharacterized protein LOC106706325 [Latimeria chalumnae]